MKRMMRQLWSLADHLHREGMPNLTKPASAKWSQQHIWNNLELREYF